VRVTAARVAAAVLCAITVTTIPASPAAADDIRESQWHLRFLNVAKAHEISKGEGVTVAVIDTGVSPHPDLRGNLLVGKDVAGGGTGDGRQDHDSHGTGMAGLIAAHGGGRATGALGIAPKAKILPVRDRTPTSRGNSDNLAAGIEWAVSHGAQVINISSSAGPTSRLRNAVKSALDADVVVVAGAGNRPAYAIGFPAYLDGVLTVGASDRTGELADISVTGKQVALVAPGVDIYSTGSEGKYRKGTGTSPATAIVSGAAALVRSRYPQLSAKEVVHRLTATATDKGPPGRDEEYGYGVLNLVAALTADVPPLEASAAASASGSAIGPATAAASVRPGAGGQRDGQTLPLALGALAVIGVVIALVLGVARRRAKVETERRT
jgi:type VII secretion-associated serine protease mycosin